MIFSALQGGWHQLRRLILDFERAFSLIHHQGEMGRDVSQCEISRSAIRSALEALEYLSALEAPHGHKISGSLRCSLARRLDGQDIQLEIYTRLALWERLWITLSTIHRDTDDESVEERCARACISMSEAIARISEQLRSDPRWSPATVYERRGDLEAEVAIVNLINQHPLFDGFSAELAPLDADILHGLDLSVRRAAPRARGWLQLSLSAEEELNRTKLRRLKRSAAVGLLSPWTLAALCMKSHVSAHQSHPEGSSLGASAHAFGVESPQLLALDLNLDFNASQRHNARLIARPLEELFATLGDSSGSRVTREYTALIKLIRLYLEQILGRRAARKYRLQRGLPESPLATLQAMTETLRS